uniref:unspecific monooxygenase n=1 Tax=Streltzoviella insularis TaxID=1206366 RepID=A0A7D5UMT2_9NEOP|nr:cytochrome P450 6 [Streltzoviella insularis]
MNGPRWKAMRQSMTPLFTSAKLKNMYYIMDKSAQDFIDYLKANSQKLKGGVYETLNMFCCAAICAAVFGIGTESTFDSPFLKVARKAVDPTFMNNLKFFIGNVSPALFKLLGLKLFGEYEDFFIGSIKRVIRYREKENVMKHDFADICISLQKNGIIKDQDSGLELEPTDELLAAQAFFFFIAGVEPSATTMFCTLIELGKNPDIMRRVHKEIDNVFEKNGGNITYDTLSEMEYLDNVLTEALRMYPPIGFLTRMCIQDTVLPVGNIKVDKGTKIFTPIFEIHHDPKYYPDPEVFNPDRFDKSINEFNDLTYMPFGKGGRLCIGSRFSRLQVKAGLVHVLRHFNFRTVVSKGGMRYNKSQVQLRPKNVDLELIPRDLMV